MIKNCKKCIAENWIKNYNLPVPRPPRKDVQATEEAFSPQKRKSSTSKHETSYSFLFLGVIFALLDPDPDPESGYGSTELKEFGSETLHKTPLCAQRLVRGY